MGKIFCLMGKSSTGKDTIFRKLISDPQLQLKPIVTYTTRPKRDSENDGVEYHFIDNATVERLQNENKVIESRVYDTAAGKWIYCTVDDGTVELNSYNYLIITTLEAYNSIKSYFGSDFVFPLYIEAGDFIRLERAIDREKRQVLPNYIELCRRFIADDSDFSFDNLVKSKINKKYLNDDLDKCVSSIKSSIIENIGK